MPLEHLFDAELQYRQGMPPIRDDGEGELVGSGEGSVHGPKVRGRLRWTLFEQPGELVCTMHPTAAIETDDGASIAVEGRGYALRERPGERRWRVAATLRFSTREHRYAWLDGALGVWEGEFDADQHRARYRAFVQTLEADTPSSHRRGLSPGERSFYTWILRSFAAGTAPAPAALAEAAVRSGVDLEATLGMLAREDLVHTDPATGAILVAYPFSGIPRGHRVLIDGRYQVEAMCAVDALGIAPMLQAPTEITSRDPRTGREVWVRIDPGDGAWWEPETAVVVDASLGIDGPSFRTCCATVNFFESGESARAYLDAHPEVRGRVLAMRDAIDLGRSLFGELLDGEGAS